jgi:hypothetical protein
VTTDYRALLAQALELIDTSPRDDATIIRHQELFERARAALAQPEPVGVPKNCWLDDEPDLCPSPCVFDDPSEVIGNCVYAQKVKQKTDCKYYRPEKDQPEPVGATDEEIDALLPLGMASYSTLCGPCEIRAFARAVLQRFGRPAITPIPMSERLPGPEDCDADGRCWFWEPDCGYNGLKWALVDRTYGCNARESAFTHWLPFHALPLPSPNCQQQP